LTPRRAVLGGALLAAAAALWPSCRRPPAALGPFPAAPVVLISIDTLRADRLGAYGHRAGATPRLDALAGEGIVFEDVSSHVPLTLPAHASLFTGLLPPRHGVRDNTGFTLDARHKTLATRFQEASRPTGAAVSAFVVRAATGLSAGFDSYDDAVDVRAAVDSLAAQQRDGAVAVESLARWVEARRERPFFAFLHLYEPHFPYTPPPQHRHLAHPYDGEIAYADELVGRFLDRLRGAGVLDRAIVAVTSDHGEGLGEHGEQEHGFLLYREAVRVPLLLRLPGGAGAGRRVAGALGQADLAPTLLELAGLPASGMDGASLVPALRSGARAGAASVYSETYFPRYHFGWSELLSVSDGRYRYIHAPRPELFDLQADPGEKRDLAKERASVADAMSGWLSRSGFLGALSEPGRVDPGVQERLQALGYVGQAVLRPATGGALADPKDKLAVYEDYRRATSLLGQRRDAEAVAALERVLKDSPGMVDARETLGTTLARMGRMADAVRALDEVLKAEPRRASTHMALMRIHALVGRRALAEKHARLASENDPAQGLETLALMALQGGQLDQAASYARSSVQADGDRVMSHFVLGTVARRQGRCEEAVAEFTRAADVQRRRPGFVVPDLHAGRGDCLARMGREAEAEAAFRAELSEFPFSRDGRVGLALLYRSQGRDQQARDALAGVVTAHPSPGANEYATVVRTFAVLGDGAAAREWARRARALFPSDPRFR
jgi:tetratricopeptide (TPR) repeat protein